MEQRESSGRLAVHSWPRAPPRLATPSHSALSSLQLGTLMTQADHREPKSVTLAYGPGTSIYQCPDIGPYSRNEPLIGREQQPGTA